MKSLNDLIHLYKRVPHINYHIMKKIAEIRSEVGYTYLATHVASTRKVFAETNKKYTRNYEQYMVEREEKRKQLLEKVAAMKSNSSGKTPSS